VAIRAGGLWYSSFSLRGGAFLVTVLGSGTGIPRLERSGPGYLLRVGGASALVDCGYGALHQLLRIGQAPSGLDAVFITHAHPDHICDLLPLLHALYLAPERSKLLQIFGPPGFRELCQRSILSLTGAPTNYELQIMDAGEYFAWAGCQVLTAPTVHSQRLASVAYRFESQRRAVVFSGDTDLDDGLSTLAHGADLLVLDCSYPDAGKVTGHLTAGECGRVAARADARQVLLSHIYPCDEPDEVRIEQCRACFSGSVLLAADLMELRV
jgi:ribonuclease BN (tRNA processing enzyme)